jgi:hypothetical protein
MIGYVVNFKGEVTVLISRNVPASTTVTWILLCFVPQICHLFPPNMSSLGE